MQIQYEVRKSKYGLGIFAQEDVKQGTMTWRATKHENIQLYSHDAFLVMLSTQCSYFVDRVVEIAYGDPSLILDGIVVPYDDSQYTNHNDTPNCGSHESVGQTNVWSEKFQDAEVVSHVYALRDIKSGEEITENYESFILPAWFVDVMMDRNMLPSYYKCIPFIVPQAVLDTSASSYVDTSVKLLSLGSGSGNKGGAVSESKESTHREFGTQTGILVGSEV